MDKFKYQLELFDSIKKKINPSLSFADEIADLLDISKDAVYRRVRGETALSLDEATLLMHKFQIENKQHANSDTVQFNYANYSDSPNEITRYLTNLNIDLTYIKSDLASELIFCAEDIPLFHYFDFPLLSAFKLFYWQKSILYTQEFQDKIFTQTIINPSLIELSKNLANHYKHIPSTEIWTENTINSLLKQIQFYAEAGFIDSSNTALQICQEAKAMIAQMEQETIKGYKSDDNSRDVFQLYLSDITIGNNCILAKLETRNFLYLSYNSFNVLKCSDNSFIQENEQWITRIIDNSIPLSKTSQKIRNKFFNDMYKKIDLLIENL